MQSQMASQMLTWIQA